MSDFTSAKRAGLVRRLQTIAVLLDRVAETTGRIIAWLTLGMVLITFTVVVLRYLFETGSIALQESVTYLHASVFMLGAAYTLKHDGHVRVDILYQKFTPRARAWVDLLGTLLLLFPVCLFILFASLGYVADSWSIQEGSREAGGLDAVFLLKTAIPVMAVLLLLQGCSILLHKLLLLAGHAVPAAADTGLDREL
jgi:TRAP-type mannitol/chloroaromatic compound transport system permease small subunit